MKNYHLALLVGEQMVILLGVERTTTRNGNSATRHYSRTARPLQSKRRLSLTGTHPKLQGGQEVEGTTGAQDIYRNTMYNIKSPIMWAFETAKETQKLIGGVMNVGHFLEGRPTYSEFDAIEAKRLQDLNDPDWYDKAITTQKDREPTWANIRSEFWEGFDNSGWLYTAIWDNVKEGGVQNAFNPTGKGNIKLEQMKRQLQLDPSLNQYMVASEYENFFVQLVGESLLDPLNLVGMVTKPLSQGIRTYKVLQRWGKYGDEVMAVLGRTGENAKKFAGLAEDAAAKVGASDFIKARKAQLARVASEQDKLAKSKKIWNYTNGAKAHEAGLEFGQVDLWMKAASVDAKEGKFVADRYLEIYDLIRKTVNGKADEAMEAWSELSKIEGWDILLTDPGARVATMMDDMGQVKKFRDALKGGADEIWEVLDESIAKQAKKYFPTIAEQVKRGDQVGAGWKAISVFHEATRPVYNFINGVFSFGYLGISPGYASRNFLQNNVQTWMDLGFVSALSPKNWFGSEELVKGWAGVRNVDSLIPGMKTGVSAAKDMAGQNGKGLINWLNKKAPFTRLGNAAEDFQAVKIYGKIYPETMKKVLNKSNVVEELMQHGFDEDLAKGIYGKLLKNKGDVTATIGEMIDDAKRGYTRAIESDLGLTSEMVNFLDETGLRDRYYEIIKNTTTKDAAKQAWDDLFGEFMDWAERSVLDEVPVAPTGDPLAEILLHVQKSAPRSVTRALTDHVTVNIRSNEEWMHVFKNLTNGYVDILFAQGKGYGKQQADKTVWDWVRGMTMEIDGKEVGLYDALFDGVFGASTKRQTERVFEKWENIRDAAASFKKSGDTESLKALWEESGLGKIFGQYDPENTDFVDKAWRAYETETRAIWGEYRDEFAGQVQRGLDGLKMKMEVELGKELPDVGQQTIKAQKLLDRAQTWDTFLHKNSIRHEIRLAKKNKDMRGAIMAWAKQYRIQVSRVVDGKPSPLEPFVKKLNNPVNMAEEDVESMVNMLIKADRKEVAVDFHKAWYNERMVRDQGLGDIAEDTLKLATDKAKAIADAEAAQKAATDELAKAADRLQKEVQSIADVVRLESGGRAVSADQYLINIINKQLNRTFKSLDEITADALTWREAEVALQAHALGEKAKVFSDPEYGIGLVKRFILGKADDFSDSQVQHVDDFLQAFKIEDADGVKKMYQMKGERDYLAKQLDNAQDATFRDKYVDELKAIDKDLDDMLKSYEDLLREREPEELASLIQKTVDSDLPKRTGDFTTWSGEFAPSEARAFWGAKDELTRVAKSMGDNIDKAWDKKITMKASKKEIKRLEKAASMMEQKVAFARRISSEVSRATRNFILHDYNAKRNIDLVLGYLMPYSFWYSRTYAKWLARVPTHAGTISAYNRYKRELGELHHGMPDWWKYQINTNELFGMDSKNPLWFNLQATLNPLQGISGVDFNDPAKRTNWFTSAIDKVGKYGPSVYTPITMAIAYTYYLQGEQELAEKWGGRLLPQSPGFKAITSMLGLNEGKGIEIDPHVLLMGKDKLDLYERKRAGRQLGLAVEAGLITREEALEAAHTMQGPVWDNAVATAQGQRAMGNFTGMMFGVGFKARNMEDLKIDQMDAEFTKFIQMKDDMSPDEVKRGYDWFRQKYPFFDTVKLSRRGINERDTGYAYNVLGRIPPAMKGDAYKSVGITYEQTQEFYEAKGIPEDWTAGQIEEFMGGMVKLGAVLAMPDDATKVEWRTVQKKDQEMYEFLEDKYGEVMKDMEAMYWDEVTENGWEAGQEFVAANPVLQEYMNEKTQIRMNDPLTAKYYASYDKARSLLWSRRQMELQEKFPGIQGLIDKYEINLGDKKAGKAFLEENPIVEEYWTARSVSEQAMNEMILSYETWLPEGEELAQPVLREDPTALENK
jgi:hypothetical protein